MLTHLMRACPPGSKENTYMRMVARILGDVASIVNRGLIDEEFFFEKQRGKSAAAEQLTGRATRAQRSLFKHARFPRCFRRRTLVD